MTVPARFVVTVINVFSLIFTLLFANSATPISVIPLIVSVTSWAFLDYDNFTRQWKTWAIVIMTISLMLVLYCALLFATCRLESHYFVVNEYVVYGIGTKIEYTYFAIPTFVICCGLIIVDLVSMNCHKQSKTKSFATYVEERTRKGRK